MRSHSRTMCLYVSTAVMLLTLAYAFPLDPIDNMCQRFWHQSVVKNNVLYIDGGMQSYTGYNSTGDHAGPIVMGYNQHLIVIPLNESWTLWDPNTNSSNITEVALNKTPASGIDGPVPQLVLGALFQGSTDDDNIWLYGGTTSWWNTSFPDFQSPTSDEYSLWGYNTKNDSWTQHSVQPNVTYRPSAGAYTEATELDLAFYFNGEIDSGSSTETQILDKIDIFLQGMIVLNLTDGTARNVSTAGVSGEYPRTRGSMVYIPGIGKMGILVLLGGTTKSVQELSAYEQNNFVSMGQVNIFDVATLFDANSSAADAGWYSQQTSGNIPDDRASFCTVVAAAPDNSSYNIYMISGNNQASGKVYDDVYILSLPSFTWTLVYPEHYWPRYGHTCHRAANRQLVTVGGAMEWGFDISCDPETHGIAVLDMTTMQWNANFNANDDPYQVPSALTPVIGGGANGGATMLAPENGYTNQGLATLMGNPSAYHSSNYTNPASSNTSSSNSHTSHTGAIVGGVVGGVIGAAILIALFVFYVKRQNKKRSRAAAMAASKDSEKPVMSQTTTNDFESGASPEFAASPAMELHTDAGPLGDYQHPHELGTKGQAAWTQAELDGKDPIAQLPTDEHGVAAELPGSNGHVHEMLDRDSHHLPTVERYELPGHDQR